MGKHIQTTNHDYYCEQGNFYRNGLHFDVDSLDDIIKDFGVGNYGDDMDLNLIYRFDIEDMNRYEDDESEKLELRLFFIAQRKGYNYSYACPLKDTAEEKEKLIKLLKPRLEHMKKLWKGIEND